MASFLMRPVIKVDACDCFPTSRRTADQNAAKRNAAGSPKAADRASRFRDHRKCAPCLPRIGGWDYMQYTAALCFYCGDHYSSPISAFEMATGAVSATSTGHTGMGIDCWESVPCLQLSLRCRVLHRHRHCSIRLHSQNGQFGSPIDHTLRAVPSHTHQHRCLASIGTTPR